MVFTNFSGGERDGGPSWVETQVEIGELPNTWKKFICMKNNIPMKQLVKYIDPEGNKYKNLQLAKQAFEVRKVDVPVNFSRRKQSLPMNVEVVSSVNVPNSISRFESAVVQDNQGKRRSLPAMANIRPEVYNTNKRDSLLQTGHQPPSLQSCEICNIAYDSKSGLDVHMRKQHGMRRGNSVPVQPIIQGSVPRKQNFQEVRNLPLSKGTIRKEMKKHDSNEHPNNQFSNFDRPGLQPNIRSRSRSNNPPPPGPMVSSTAPWSVSGQNARRESSPSVLKNIKLFPCDECGIEVPSYEQLQEHMRIMHDSPEKLIENNDIVLGFRGRNGERKATKFEEMDNLEFQDENDFDQNDDGLENPAYPSGFDDETDEQSINEEEMEEEVEEECQDDYIEQEKSQLWDEENEEEYYNEERQEEYYDEDEENDIDEVEDNDIEVISSGVKNLPKFQNEIEVIEHNRNTSLKSSHGRTRLMVRNTSLDSLKTRYSQITINRKDVSDDGSSYDEDNSDISEDEDIHQLPDPEEITLDDEPDEITLDEGEDDIEDDIIQTEEYHERENMEKIQNYLKMIANTDFVRDLDENQEKLQSFNQNAWYAKPVTWKPSKMGEMWHATVSQICSHFHLKDYPVEPNWWFKNWDSFNEFFTEVLENINPDKPQSSIFKLKKAKWFQYLHPAIPADKHFLEETIDD